MLSDFFHEPEEEGAAGVEKKKKKNRRPRLQFDPQDDVLREALDFLGEELNISPGHVMNYGTLLALVELLKNEPSTAERIYPIKSLRFSVGLKADDLIEDAARLLKEYQKKSTRNK
jgi:hypothetical protein